MAFMVKWRLRCGRIETHSVLFDFFIDRLKRNACALNTKAFSLFIHLLSSSVIIFRLPHSMWFYTSCLKSQNTCHDYTSQIITILSFWRLIHCDCKCDFMFIQFFIAVVSLTLHFGFKCTHCAQLWHKRSGWQAGRHMWKHKGRNENENEARKIHFVGTKNPNSENRWTARQRTHTHARTQVDAWCHFTQAFSICTKEIISI